MSGLSGVWVRDLSCSAKHARVWLLCAAKLQVCVPHPHLPLGSLLPGAVQCTFSARMPLVVRAHALVCRVWVRQVGPESHPPLPSAACGRGWGVSLLAARARTLGSARARARAPRLQPSARSCFRCHRLLPEAAACSKLGVPSARPLALRQEDECEEDAWAREYRDGFGPGGNRARAEDGLRADAPPCGWLRALAWYRHPDPDRDSGQPLPQPTPEGRKEGRRAPVSKGARAGREPPPVRLETVATATGLRSPATRLRGGDAPSPTTAGGAGGGRGCTVERASPFWPVWVCLPQHVELGVRESGSVGMSRLPRGCSRRHRAPRVAANVEAAQTLGPLPEEAWRLLGLGSLPSNHHC